MKVKQKGSSYFWHTNFLSMKAFLALSVYYKSHLCIIRYPNTLNGDDALQVADLFFEWGIVKKEAGNCKNNRSGSIFLFSLYRAFWRKWNSSVSSHLTCEKNSLCSQFFTWEHIQTWFPSKETKDVYSLDSGITKEHLHFFWCEPRLSNFWCLWHGNILK